MARFVFHELGHNTIEVRLTQECYNACSHQGNCDADVEAWVNELRPKLSKLSPAIIARILKSYGAWDADELADHEANLHRFLWCAAGDCKDNHSCWTWMEA